MLDSCVTNYFPLADNLLLWVTELDEQGNTWYVVSDINRTEYSLWKNGKQTRYKSDNLLDLYDKIK